MRARSVEDYLAELPDEQQATLKRVRTSILAAAPEAVESIAYGMPVYKCRGKVLTYIGAAKKHCAIYGMAAVFAAHKGDLRRYDVSKGTVRFPVGKPPPASLVRKLIRARVAEIEAAGGGKSGRSAKS